MLRAISKDAVALEPILITIGDYCTHEVEVKQRYRNVGSVTSIEFQVKKPFLSIPLLRSCKTTHPSSCHNIFKNNLNPTQSSKIEPKHTTAGLR